MAALERLVPGASVWTRIAQLRQKDPACLAPAFRAALTSGVERARAAGVDAVIFETCRSDELQAIYYAQGTTHARTAAYSWHKYGLGADVISAAREWGAFADRDWVRTLRRAMEAEWFVRDGQRVPLLAWGGLWKSPDEPHWQWGRCRPTPSQLTLDAYARGGAPAVWRLVQAT